MATRSLDIGFNRNLIAHPTANQGRPLLSQGLTKVGFPGNPVMVARELTTDDDLILTIYDLTSFEALDSKVTGMSLKISFSNAVDQESSTPLAEGNTVENFWIVKGLNQKSTVFGEEKWNHYFVDSDGPEYPTNQLTSSASSLAKLDLVHVGHFYFTLLLKVVWDHREEDAKTFRVDPEMIIDYGGGGPGGCGGGSE